MGELSAGSASTDITPSVPIAMGGFGQRAGSRSLGVHDRLFAKALYLDDGEGKLLMLTTDLISVPNALAREVSSRISEVLAIELAQICISASHTHSGPATTEFPVRTPEVAEYSDLLGRALLETAQRAVADASPCRLKAGTGSVDFMFNRRTRGNPNRVDDRIFALLVEEIAASRPKAVLFGCGCHPVTLGHDNYLISADYPGYAQRMIQDETGAEHALFFNMSEGNVIPETRGSYDSLDTRGYLGGTFADAERIGRLLADEVSRVLTAATPISEPRLAVQKTDCSVMPNRHAMDLDSARTELAASQAVLAEYLGDAYLELSPEDLTPLVTLWRDASREVVERDMSEAEMRRLMSAVSNTLVLFNTLFNPARQQPIDLPVQVICIGDFAFLALPGEILVEISLDWQQRSASGSAHGFVIGLANGLMGYIPHGSSFEELGAEHKYETIMNAMEPRAAEIALDAAQKLLGELRPRGYARPG